MEENKIELINMDFDGLDNKIAEAKANVPIFKEKPKEETQTKTTDKSSELVDNMFHEAVVHTVRNDENLQKNVLDTAKKYTETKMQTIATNVDTEHKRAVFNNSKDACESYGLDEETTPIWATKAMTVGYDIMLAIWLFIGSFTFMPIIFVCKKIKVGIRATWLSIVLALIIYAIVVVGVPLIIKLTKGGV